MKIYTAIKHKKLSTSILTAMLLVMSSSVWAQIAPLFNNSIMQDNDTYVYLIGERLEYNSVPGADPLSWDVQGYVGKDLNKFWFKTEGSALTSQKEGEMEFQGLYSRMISPYFDFQAGLRYDISYNRLQNLSRSFAAIGLQGLAPYLFETETNLFISDHGDISARLLGTYDLLFTQRLVGQPRFETNIAIQKVEKFGVGSGFNNIQLGFRLRYEIRRELAPYIGISWNRQLGQTADFIRQEGGDVSSFSLLGGVRLWM